jgi:catechol 2,3-dioxygenase-like lactoylglutathione lyase family enzyme
MTMIDPAQDPIIRVSDVAWVRLASPDLDIAERFLSDFGLIRSARTETALYMRGRDGAHHMHITELGEPKVLAIGFAAASASDLVRLSMQAAGASSVAPLNEPGGGTCVRLRDNNGFTIEVAHGVETVAPLPARHSVYNTGEERRRLGVLQRIEPRPSEIKRMGHAVVSTPDIEGSVAWVGRHLGLRVSEYVHAEDDPAMLLATFVRADRGADYVDHHTMMFGRHHKAGLNHISYEVQDIDDLQAGHDWLVQSRYDHLWGIGRHLLGSQIFDYWKDPWGRVHEHWTDTDVLNNETPPRRVPRSEGLRSQWGPQAPQEFRDAASV